MASDDANLENGLRRILWVLARDVAKEDPPASRHLSDLAAGFRPALERVPPARMERLLAGLLFADVETARSRLLRFDCTEEERVRARVVLTAEIARVRVALECSGSISPELVAFAAQARRLSGEVAHE